LVLRKKWHRDCGAFFRLLLSGFCFFDDLLAIGKTHSETNQHVACTKEEQVFKDIRHLFVVEEDSGNVGEQNQDNLENVECLVLARLQLREEQRAHHQESRCNEDDDRKPEEESTRVCKDTLAFEENDKSGIDHACESGGESREVVVVCVGIASVVLGKTHGCAEYVNGESDDQQESVVLEPVWCVNLVGEEKAECRGKAERNQVGKTVELGAEFRARIHEAGGKTVKLVKKGTQHDKVGTHADLVCRAKRTERSGCPANGENTQQKVQACESIWQNKT